jgi:hypothetical protein
MAVRIIILLLFINCSLFGQFTITYYQKCDQLAFHNGANTIDTTYNIYTDADSLVAGNVDYYWSYSCGNPSIDSCLMIADEDLDTSMYITTTTDTSYFTILQACDTCMNKTIECYNYYSSGSWGNTCIDSGWVVIANRVIDDTYLLGLSGTKYPTVLYVEIQNRNTTEKVWQYLYVVPNNVAIKYNRSLLCKDTKVYYTKKHTIYANSCSLEDIL